VDVAGLIRPHRRESRHGPVERELRSLIGVGSQMVNILTEQNVQVSWVNSDRRTFSSCRSWATGSSFVNSPKVIPISERAACRHRTACCSGRVAGGSGYLARLHHSAGSLESCRSPRHVGLASSIHELWTTFHQASAGERAEAISAASTL
jgi:hypothetical protein